MGVYKKGHYHSLNSANNKFSWNMQARACLYPVKNTGSLFHTHYTLQFLSLTKIFSKATHLKSFETKHFTLMIFR